MTLQDYADHMRDKNALDDPVVEWGPGWSHAGSLDNGNEDDDCEVSIQVQPMGRPYESDSIAAIVLTEVFIDVGRGHAHTIGLELTLRDVVNLIERLEEVLA